MAKIIPTFSLTSSNHTVSTNAGPQSMALALQVADSLDVDLVEIKNIPAVPNGTPATVANSPHTSSTLIKGADFGTASSSSSGVTGCFVYIKNTSSTAVTNTEVIYIGHTTDADEGSGGYTELSTNDENVRLFTLKAGEFAFFPYDYTGSLYCDASAASQSLEFMRWDRV